METAAIYFLENIYLKQGDSYEYVMDDIICMGLLDLWEERTEKFKIKKDSNPEPSAYEAKSLSVALLYEKSTKHLRQFLGKQDLGQISFKFEMIIKNKF